MAVALAPALARNGLAPRQVEELRWIPTNDLFVDPSVQRDLRPAWSQFLIDYFNPLFVGTLCVSARPGGRFAVICGQHRLVAAREHGIQALACHVYFNLTEEDEAGMFVATATVKATHPLDLFRLRVKSGEPVALGIEDILHRHGSRVAWKAQVGYTAVKKLERVYRFDPALLDTVVGLVETLWPAQREARTETVIEGVAQFHLCYAGQYDLGNLRERIGRVSLTTMLMEALVSGRGKRVAPSQVFAVQLKDAYNRMARLRLGEFTPTQMRAPR